MERVAALILVTVLLAVPTPASVATEVDLWMSTFCGAWGADYDSQKGACVVIDSDGGGRYCETLVALDGCYESANDLVRGAKMGG